MREDPEKITYFGAMNARGKDTPFGIRRKDRVRHMYVIGKTGMGKSTLLENMAIQDIRNGEGMAFIDPHGSTADRLLEYIPESRIKDVLYFAPFDMENPIAFNVMEDVGYDKRHLVVSGLISAFRKIWVDTWSARMEYILSNTLLALLEYPGATLLDVNRLLINKAFRKKVVENVTDPIVKSFWVDEFANYTDRYTQDATPAIQNKVGQFTSNPLIRNIVGQPKSSFDIREMMDTKKIIIINLSKGRVGEVNATLLGSMLVTKIYLAAMSRADVAAPQMAGLSNFYFYVDEFQTFANQSFADILSEARKYKLNLIIAHQYIEQMEEEVRDAVFGNVGTTVAFRVGPFDAEVLETIFKPQFTIEDLVNLGFAQVYLTLMIDGVGSPPFSAVTLPPFDPPPQRFVEEVLANSRLVFGKPRAEVEKAIADWQMVETNEAAAAVAARLKKPAVISSAPVSPSISRPLPQPQTSLPRPTAPAMPPKKDQPASSKPHQSPPQHQALQPHASPSPKTPHHTNKPPEQERREQQPPREKNNPPLEGASSLRQALEHATGTKLAEAPRHAADLKDTLKKVAPQSIEKPPPPAMPVNPLPQTPKEKPAVIPPEKKPERKPNHMPEPELRKMLEVEDLGLGN